MPRSSNAACGCNPPFGVLSSFTLPATCCACCGLAPPTCTSNAAMTPNITEYGFDFIRPPGSEICDNFARDFNLLLRFGSLLLGQRQFCRKHARARPGEDNSRHLRKPS